MTVIHHSSILLILFCSALSKEHVLSKCFLISLEREKDNNKELDRKTRPPGKKTGRREDKAASKCALIGMRRGLVSENCTRCF